MKDMIYSLSAAAIITSLIYIFMPKKDKMLRFVITLVFIVTVVLPMIYTVPKSVDINTDYIDSTNDAFYEIKVKQAEAMIADILLKNNIKFKKIYVFANTSEEYNISINKVIIESNDDADKIYSSLASLDFLKVVQKYEE